QRLRFAGEQALRGEHVLDFRSADAEGEASECAVRAGMGVAANDSHSRQGRAVLRADDVNDPLAQVTKWEVSLGAELADVAIERVDLDAGSRIGNALLPVLGRRIMVGRCDDRAAAPWLAAGELESFERLGAGDFVHQMAIDVEQRGAVALRANDVVVPEL